MKKLIDIKGELDEKGSVAHRLALKATEVGKNLKNYIETLLENHVL